MGLMRHRRRRHSTLLAPAVALAVLAVPLAGRGSAEPSTPAYYRVPAGRGFQFSIDYSRLAKDPNADKSGAGYLYAPGSPVAVWS
jgi:hypothetical protein